MSTAGWLTACRRVLGASWLVTPQGVLEADQARTLASAADLTPPGDVASLARRLPTVVKTALKDGRQFVRGRGFQLDVDGPWAGHTVDFVWQRHELFHSAGVDLARGLDVPSVVFAPATHVWEARRWGVTRPGWGGLVERFGEAPTLRAATLVACGSDEVAEQVVRMGVPSRSVIITPTGVEIGAEPTASDRRAARQRLGLGDDFVLGWMGSFRPFHAVHRLVEAVAGEPGITLLLVGDGPERPLVEARASELGVRAVFTGTVAHASLPDHMAAMDAAAVVAPDDGTFHYSPLKLAEYLAAGLAVIAPDVPTVASRLVSGTNALLVPPTDRALLSKAVVTLRDDPELRRAIGRSARAEAEANWSWDEQIRRIHHRLLGHG